uniref:Pyrin domain-containing protein n=1 Tax=Rousettus aegyptiacus TaxID=9407 RepID=A0A7J8CJU0_ROUAE|nr:hypothetical protein HJG63_014210 [Rousettus aegyptiacus]
MKNYEEQQAWSLTFSIFQMINQKDLFEKAQREITGYTRKYQAYVKEKFSNLWFEESITRIYDHLEKELTQKECDNLEFLFLPKKIGKRKLEEFKGLGRQRSSSS